MIAIIFIAVGVIFLAQGMDQLFNPPSARPPREDIESDDVQA